MYQLLPVVGVSGTYGILGGGIMDLFYILIVIIVIIIYTFVKICRPIYFNACQF